MRSDFLGATQKHPHLNQLISTQGYLVAAMSEEGLREAIAKPAELAGHPLDLSTVNLLIEQTADREGALPLLQFALLRIWAGLKEGKEPAETLTEIRGVGGALAGEAQRIYDGLATEEQRIIARRVFLGLVQLGEGAKDTRRRVELERLVSHRDSLDQVKQVIDRFADRDARLITLVNDGGATTAEVTHEALLFDNNWPQLEEWLNGGGRSDLRFQRRLDDAVMAWLDNGRPEGNLWRSPDLDLLRRYQERAGDDLTPFQLEFFQASIDAEKAQQELEQKLIQTEKDLAQVKQNAELEQLKAEKDLAAANLTAALKQKQHRQILMWVMGIALFLSSGAAILALLKAKEAEHQRVEQLATNAEVLLTNNQTVDAVINAIAATGLSQSALVQFPNRPQFGSVEGSLLDVIRENREQNQLFHQSEVSSVAYSLDGDRIISSDRDNVKIWDAKTGAPITIDTKNLQIPKNNVIYAVSPNGQKIVIGSDDIGSDDNVLKIWDVKTGETIGKPLHCQSMVRLVVFSPDAERIVIADENSLRIWNAKTGETIDKPFQDDQVLSVAFSRNGERIATGSQNGSVKIWDVNKEAPIDKPLQVIAPKVVSVAFSRRGRRITSGNAAVTSVAFNRDGGSIISGNANGLVQIWDINTRLPIGEPLSGHTNVVTSLAFSSDGERIVSGSDDNTVRIWDVKMGSLIGEPLQGHNRDVTSVAFSLDGKHIISGSDDKTVRIWDAQTKSPIFKRSHTGNKAASVAFSQDGQLIVSGSNNTVQIWDANSGKPLLPLLHGHTERVKSVAFSRDGQRIVSGGYDKTVRIWDVKTRSLIATSPQGKEAIISVAFSPNGQRIVSGSRNTVQIWDANTGKPIGGILKGQGQFFRVAFSPDGQHIVSRNGQRTVQIWDTNANANATIIKAPTKNSQVKFISSDYNSDDMLVIENYDDDTTGIWDGNTGMLIGRPLKSLGDLVRSVAFSPDRQRIVSHNSSRMQIWDVRTGYPIGKPLDGNSINSIAFSRDGKRIVSGGRYGITIWDVSWESLLSIACDRLEYHPNLRQPTTDVPRQAKQTCEPYYVRKK
jgi:WD40 repeat protein